MRSLGWAPIQGDRCLYKKNKFVAVTFTKGRCHVDRGQRWHRQVQSRVLNQTFPHHPKEPAYLTIDGESLQL